MQSDNNHVPFIKHFVALSFLIILLNSCFDPDEEHFVEVQRVDDPGLLKIDIEPADDPVMYVSGEKITFNVTPMNNQKIMAIQLLRDSTVLRQRNGSGTQMSIKMFDILASLQEGINEMSVRVVTASQSGSLADYIGAEGFVFERKFRIAKISDNYIPNIISAFEEDGSLKIKWGKYTGEGFHSYRIESKFYGYRRLVGEVFDIDSTSIFDTTYAGTAMEYSLSVLLFGGETVKESKSRYNFSGGVIPRLYAVPSDGPALKIIWDKSRYYNNILGYKIYRIEGSEQNLLKFVQDPDSTNLLYTDATFPGKNKIKLTVIPKGVDSNVTVFQNYLSSFGEYLSGEESFNFKIPKWLAGSRFLYVNEKDWVCLKTDPDENQDFLFGLPDWFSICFSPTGKYAAFTDNNNRHNLYDIVSKELIATVTTSDFLPDGYNYRISSIADNGMAVFNNSKDLAFYNMIEKKAYTSPDRFSLTGETKISPDGKYIVLEDFYNPVVLRLNGGNLEIVKKFSDAHDFNFFEISPIDGSRLILSDGDNIREYELASMDLLESHSISSERIYNIEYDKGLILIAGDGFIKIKDFNTGETIKQIRHGGNYSPYSNDLILVGNYLYYDGRRMKISEID